jgi:hypothetical protein
MPVFLLVAQVSDEAAFTGVVHRRLDMVRFLLAHGAAIELPDDQPWTTPRFWARHLEEPAMIQALADNQ